MPQECRGGAARPPDILIAFTTCQPGVMASHTASADRFGLSCFDAVDTSGQPALDAEEDLAGTFPQVGLRLGDQAATAAGTLHITST